MYWLRASIEPAPPGTSPEHTAVDTGHGTVGGTVGGGAQRSGTLEATAETYADALAALRAQVLPGWRLLALMPDYDRVIAHLHGRPHPATEPG